MCKRWKKFYKNIGTGFGSYLKLQGLKPTNLIIDKWFSNEIECNSIAILIISSFENWFMSILDILAAYSLFLFEQL